MMVTGLDEDDWNALSGRGMPAVVTRMPSDRGGYGALWHATWPDGATAVLKIGRDRVRAARELDAYRVFSSNPETPRLLGSLETANHVVLLLEDLSPWVAGDILEGVATERALLAVATLGRLHARHHDTRPLDWPARPPRWRVTSQETIQAFVDRYPHPWAMAALPQLPASVERYRPVLDALSLTIIHGDAHLDNWMFHPTAPRAVLLDWEAARLAPGVVDLARFLMEGVHADVRRAATDELIAAWRDAAGATDDLEGLRAGIWYGIDGMVPYHATVDLDALSPRMRAVHRQCVRQALDVAADLLW
jgi:hypothetical protein